MAEDKSTVDQLTDMLFGEPKRAGNDIARQRYKAYVQRMKSQGRSPVSFEKWKKGER